MHCMHCRVREGGRSGFGKTSSGASLMKAFPGVLQSILRLGCSMLTPLPVSMVLQTFTNCLTR